MQNKHETFFSFFGGPTYGEGEGGSAGWAKSPSFSDFFFIAPLMFMFKMYLNIAKGIKSFIHGNNRQYKKNALHLCT